MAGEIESCILIAGAEIKIAAARNRMSNSTDQRILRMHEGRIRNLKAHLAMKLEELDGNAAMVTGERVAVLVIDR